MSDLVFDPILPIGAIAALAVVLAALTAVIYTRVGRSVSAVQRTVLLLLRVLGLLLVLVILLQPSRVEPVPSPQLDRVTLFAVDDSRSMAQRDVDAGTRLDGAKRLLTDAELLKPDGTAANPSSRFFKFAETATPLAQADELTASGASTRVHASVNAMLGSLRATEAARALILFSDGHDFEMANPSKTGFAARARGTPLYAVAIGRQGRVRDVSMRITRDRKSVV